MLNKKPLGNGWFFVWENVCYNMCMKNPFDETFFKFLLGFSFILTASFTILFFVGKYSSTLTEQEVTVFQEK
jgi:hypothetical protein